MLRATALVAILAMVMPSACARLVTAEPETVARRNSAWLLRSTPAPASAPPAETAAPTAPSPVTPLPFRHRPEVVAALSSPPDSLGIPEALYTVDPLLADFRRDMAAQTSARRLVGTGTVVLGALSAAFGALALSVGSKRLDSRDDSVKSSGNSLIFDGAVLGALGLGYLVAGVANLASSSDAAPLQRYYRETYVDAASKAP
jgi:hypothetical protein